MLEVFFVEPLKCGGMLTSSAESRSGLDDCMTLATALIGKLSGLLTVVHLDIVDTVRLPVLNYR